MADAETHKLAHGAPRAGEIVAFWRAAGPARWFARSDAFDARLRARFSGRVEEAASGRLDHWADTPEGALARILLLDQLPRNLHRDMPRMFETDVVARQAANAALAAGHDKAFARDLRQFFYLPFMHSEDMADQERALALYEALGDEDALKFAHVHVDAIRRFGRYPHRNAILGRATTPEEQAYLDEGGFSG